MTKLADLVPTERNRVIDLVRQAGVNVSNWSKFKGGRRNAGSNPKYCYEWAFVEPTKLVVLNLWHKLMQSRDGSIVLDLNLRDVAKQFDHLPNKGPLQKRALNTDLAIQTAVKHRLPIRVIVLGGEMRADTGIASRVKKRVLDPVPWAITYYDWSNGECVITRGTRPSNLSLDSLARKFDRKALEVYERAQRLCGYRPNRFLQKIRRHGGVAAAKQWLNPKEPAPTRGFLHLANAGRLDLSLEALVLRTPWRALFTIDELRVAAERLHDFGYGHDQTGSSKRRAFLPEEIPEELTVLEGAKTVITVNAYERSQKARQLCLKYYGRGCIACGIDFGKAYGKPFEGLIHVHHIRPLATVGENYELNPIRDLRPVCPNCHAAMHKQEPPFTEFEIRTFLKRQSRPKRP